MKTRRLIGLIGITTLVLFLSGFGTQAVGQDYWYVGNDGVWAKNSNWVTSLTTMSNSGTYPGPLDNAHFRPLYDQSTPPQRINDNYITILAGGTAVAGLYLETGSYTYLGITTEVPMELAIYTNGTLTVNTEVDLASGTRIELPSTASASPALQLNGIVNLDAGFFSQTGDVISIIKATEIHGTYSTTKKNIYLGPNSHLSMGDLRATYFGLGVNVHLFNPSGPVSSSVRFKDVVTIDANIDLGTSHNLWLDEDAALVPAPNNQQQKYFFMPSTIQRTNPPTANGIGNYVGGLIVKAKSYWVDDNNNQSWNTGNWPTSTDGYFEFPVGSHSGGQNLRESYIAIWIKKALNLPVGSASVGQWEPNQYEPFRGVGVRIVDAQHPENGATRPVERYWVLQPFGMYQDNGPIWSPLTAPLTEQTNTGSGSWNWICIQAQVFTSDVTAPSRAYAARYTNNWEETQGNWYSDGSITGGTNIRSRTWVEMCGNSDAAWGFGDVSIADATDPLPVELTSFSARVIDNTVKLNWETATELNNFGFYVERSADGENWDEVGFVMGYGTSYSPKSYVYLDELSDELTRLPQLAYRLRQMDRDGTTDYSNIVFVKTGEMPSGIELYAAYPNPFNPATTISFAISEPANVNLKVYNTLGQVVATLLASSEMDAGLHTVPFNGDQLPSGIYMAVLEANGAQQHQKLVLNK